MLSVTSRWKIRPPSPATKLAIANSDGGAMFTDEKGQLTLLDPDGRSLWSRVAEDSVRAVAMTAQGKGGFLLTVRDLARYGISGKAVWRIATPPFPIELAVRPDGNALAVGADSGMVKTWNGQGKEGWSRRLPHSADYLAFLPDSTALLVVSKRGEITFLDEQGAPAWKLSLGCEACQPDLSADRIVVPSFDGVQAFGADGAGLGLYDVGAPTVRAMLGNGGRSLLVQDARRRLLLLDPVTGDTRWQYTFEDEPRDVAFAPDGSAILVATWAGEIERLDVANVASVSETSAAPQPTPATGNFLEVEGVAAAAAASSGIRVTPKARWRTPVEVRGGVELAVLPAGAGVALLDEERQVLELFTGQALPAWGASHLGPDAQLRASASGSPIVAGGSRGLRFFEPSSGEIANAALAVRVLDVARDAGFVVAGTEAGRLHLFDAAGRALWDVPTPGFQSVSISPDGNVIGLVRGGSLLVQVRGGKGGFQKSVAAESAPDDVPLRALVLDDGVFWASRAGRLGLFSLDGASQFEDALPPGFPPSGLERGGTGVILRTGGGLYFFDPRARALAPMPAPARRPESRSRFASFMDRLLEFRYDSKEIACLEARTGALCWKRAVASLPLAVSVSADGAALAGIVAGELVLYDLVAGSAEPASTPPVETPPSFLEL